MNFRFVFLLFFLGVVSSYASSPVVLKSPDGNLRGEISVKAAGELGFSVAQAGRIPIEPSRMGITVDGEDLGSGVALGDASFGEIDETHAVLGGKAQATNRARAVKIPIMSANGSASALTVGARAYDDGFAWRLLVSGSGQRQVQGEATGWTLPQNSRVWFFERDSDWKLKSYAGEWIATDVEKLATVSKQGPVQGTPLVAELAKGAGCVLVSEAALENYSGLRLRARAGTRVVQADFTEGAKGFGVEGPIITPWRVTLVAKNLDELVTSSLIANLAPAPDVRWFADTSYIKPGRAGWGWWSSGTGAPVEEREFVDYAVKLGFGIFL